MRKLLEQLHVLKPVPVLPIQAGADVAGGAQPPGRIESVTVGASLVEADKAAGDAVLAERKRIAAITAVARQEQAEMRDRLIAEGTPAIDAVLALCQAQPKAAAAPPVSVKEVAAEMLAMINAAAPAPTPTMAQAEKNVLEQYNEIKDPAASAEFYKQHKAEIDSLSNQKSKKEGK